MVLHGLKLYQELMKLSVRIQGTVYNPNIILKKLNDYSVVYHFFIFRTNFSLWLQKALSRHHCTVRTGLRR